MMRKPSHFPPRLLLLITVSLWVTTYLAGNLTGRWIFPGWSEPSDAMAAPEIEGLAQITPPVATIKPQTQENTLFILLGSRATGTRPTVWYISDLPESPVFMRLLVPSARFGETFDQDFYKLNVQLVLSGSDKKAIEALFAIHGLTWDRIMIMDITMLANILLELPGKVNGQSGIDPAKILSPLPLLENDLRDRTRTIQDQIDLWNGLCPLFLSESADPTAARHLFRLHPVYPICEVTDDLH